MEDKSALMTIKKEFPHNSVFFRTLIILLTLILVMVAFFLLYAVQIMNHFNQRYAEDTTLLMLTQNASASDAILNNLDELARQTLDNSAAISYMINPHDAEPQLEYQVIQNLFQLTSDTSLVQQTWLYSPYSNMVLTSTGTKATLGNFPDTAILQQLLAQELPDHIVPFYLDGRLFCIRTFAPAQTVGYLIFEIDRTTLYQMLGLAASSTYLFDRNGYLIEGGESACPYKDSIQVGDSSAFITEADSNTDGKKWYMASGSVSGWYFVRSAATARYTVPTCEWIQILLPGILLFLVFGLLLSYRLTCSIYKPINKLISLVLQTSKKSKESQFTGNEWDYLTLSYFNTVHEKTRLENTLEGFTHDILEQTLRNILLGKEIEASELRTLLESLHDPIRENGLYTVMVCQSITGISTASAAMNTNLFFRSVQNILQNNQAIKGYPVEILMNDSTIAVVCYYTAETSAAVARKEMQHFRTVIEASFHSTPFEVIVGFGSVCGNLTAIDTSYQAAVKNVQYACYNQQNNMLPERTADADEDKDEGKAFSARLETILKQAAHTAQEDVHAQLEGLIAELGTVGNTPDICKIFQDLEDLILETLTEYSMDYDTNETDMLSRPSPSDSAAAAILKIRAVLMTQLDKICEYSKKNRYRYVEDAVKYLQDHYTDSNLTANEVAEELHIHASYFSVVFNEVIKESFSAYLNRIRVEHACRLLQLTQFSIADIGFKCGFSTVQNFNRVFKKQQAMTPTQYRDSHKERTGIEHE